MSYRQGVLGDRWTLALLHQVESTAVHAVHSRAAVLTPAQIADLRRVLERQFEGMFRGLVVRPHLTFTREDWGGDRALTTVRWSPGTATAEHFGGPHDGHVFEAKLDPDGRPIPPETYQIGGWNDLRGRWVITPHGHWLR